jgi:hypothetical protein
MEFRSTGSFSTLFHLGITLIDVFPAALFYLQEFDASVTCVAKSLICWKQTRAVQGYAQPQMW